jgi:hypothetical protein
VGKKRGVNERLTPLFFFKAGGAQAVGAQAARLQGARSAKNAFEPFKAVAMLEPANHHPPQTAPR